MRTEQASRLQLVTDRMWCYMSIAARIRMHETVLNRVH